MPYYNRSILKSAKRKEEKFLQLFRKRKKRLFTYIVAIFFYCSSFNQMFVIILNVTNQYLPSGNLHGNNMDHMPIWTVTDKQ